MSKYIHKNLWSVDVQHANCLTQSSCLPKAPHSKTVYPVFLGLDRSEGHIQTQLKLVTHKSKLVYFLSPALVLLSCLYFILHFSSLPKCIQKISSRLQVNKDYLSVNLSHKKGNLRPFLPCVFLLIRLQGSHLSNCVKCCLFQTIWNMPKGLTI